MSLTPLNFGLKLYYSLLLCPKINWGKSGNRRIHSVDCNDYFGLFLLIHVGLTKLYKAFQWMQASLTIAIW